MVEFNKQEILFEIQQKKRIVIKIGTNSILERNGDFNFVSIAKLIKDIKLLRGENKEILLVSSGAVSAGKKCMQMKNRPNDIVAQQVLAAIGNPILMQHYITIFKDTIIAQILLSQHDLSDRQSYQHFRNAMEKMLEMGIIPIINENDVVSIDELIGTSHNPLRSQEYNFSDNDVLSSLVCGAVDADLLLILSDIDGLYTKHPNSSEAKFIDIVPKIDDKIHQMAKGEDKGGRGGMRTKIKAAEISSKGGAYTIISSAQDFSIHKLFNNKQKCTIFLPNPVASKRSHWLLYAANAVGAVIIDEGAKNALNKGASLLLPGIQKVSGKFRQDDVINIIGPDNIPFLKGISNYSSKVIKERIEQLKIKILPKKTFIIIEHEDMETI